MKILILILLSSIILMSAKEDTKNSKIVNCGWDSITNTIVEVTPNSNCQLIQHWQTTQWTKGIPMIVGNYWITIGEPCNIAPPPSNSD